MHVQQNTLLGFWLLAGESAGRSHGSLWSWAGRWEEHLQLLVWLCHLVVFTWFSTGSDATCVRVFSAQVYVELW